MLKPTCGSLLRACLLCLGVCSTALAQQATIGGSQGNQPELAPGHIDQINQLLQEMAQGGADGVSGSSVQSTVDSSIRKSLHKSQTLEMNTLAVQATIANAKTYFPDLKVNTWGETAIGFTPPRAGAPATLTVPSWAVK